MKGYVYCLKDQNDRVIYIGATINPKVRRNDHMNKCKRGKNKLYTYIRENNLVISFEVLETLNCELNDDLMRAEAKWVKKMYKKGEPIQNHGHTKYLKRKENVRSGSIKMDPTVLYEAKKYCKDRGLFLANYINNAVSKQLQNDKA